MESCQKKFWLDKPSNLWSRSKIIPSSNTCLGEQMNTVTRLTLCIFVISLIMTTPRASFMFLVISSLFIIILYLIQKKTMSRENYKCAERIAPNSAPILHKVKKTYSLNQPTYNRFCNDEVAQDLSSSYMSQNQRLAGQANPKTLINPIIAPPIADMDHWRDNSLVNHSAINTASHYDSYLSGYKVSDNSNKSIYISPVNPPPMRNSIILNDRETYNSGNIEMPYEINPNKSGWVNTSCGYNPDQIKYNLPSNINAGNCDKSSELSKHNKNVFTQNIQPDIYTRSNIIEPINSNAGISYTQQFRPTTSSRNNGDGLTYTEHDPRVYKDTKIKTLDMGITESSVYDPRHSGHGTSYRGYNEKMTGQPRFYYDDINSVRMPNYITRSNIDHAIYADTYGPLNSQNKNGSKHTKNIRALAQDKFLRDSLQQRTELQERLMRKRNGELWQMRKYPSHTMG
jgi:hypothetical protein